MSNGNNDRGEVNIKDVISNLKSGGPKFTNATLPLLLLIVLVLVAWAASGIYIVKPTEEAAIKRFGQYNRTTGPGINWHLPFPIETVDRAEVTKIHRLEVGFNTGSGVSRLNKNQAYMLTGDENIVSLAFAVQYKIEDLYSYLYKVDGQENTMLEIAESSMRAVVGREMIDDLLTTEKSRIQIEVQDHMQDIVDFYELGFRIINVQLQDVNPPEPVVAAFKDVASAREDMNRLMDEAEAYANDIIPKARGIAAKRIFDAEAFAEEVIEKAIGDASRFDDMYASYVSSPDVTKRRMLLDTMSEVMKVSNKKIFDDSIDGLFPMMNIPQNANSNVIEGVR